MDNLIDDLPQPQVPRLYSVGAVAELLDVHPNYVWKLLHDGVLSRVKVGRGTRVREDELLAWIATNTNRGVA